MKLQEIPARAIVLSILLALLGAAARAETYTPEAPASAVSLPGEALIYAEPSFDAPVIGNAENGAQVSVVSMIGDWVRVVASGVDGYMPRNTINSVPTAAPKTTGGERLVRVANEDPETMLPLRAVPDERSDIVAAYSNGVEAMILDEPEEDGKYALVRVGEGQSSLEGYMDINSLARDGQPVDLRTSVVIVTASGGLDWLNLRERPDAQSRALGQFAVGMPVEVLGVMGEWFHVLVEGQVGFMMSSYLSPVNDVSFLASEPLILEAGQLPVTLQLIDTAMPNGQGGKTGVVRILSEAGGQIIPVYYTGSLRDAETFIIEDVNFDEMPDFRVCSRMADGDKYYEYWLYNTLLKRFTRSIAFDTLESNPVFSVGEKLVRASRGSGVDLQKYTYEIINNIPQQTDE